MNRRLILITILVIAVMVSLVACVTNEPKDCTVLFQYDFGGETITKIVQEGKKVIPPANPTREGYMFLYWGRDGKEFDFTKPIKGDLVLKAEWEKLLSINLIVGSETKKIYIRNKDSYTLDDFELGVKDAKLTAIYTMQEGVPTLFDLHQNIAEGTTMYADLTSNGMVLEKKTGTTSGSTTASVKKYNGASKHIYVPTFYDGVLVGDIGVQAFDHKEISSIVLPRAVKTINIGAFAHITIDEFVLPASVTTIDTNAFAEATIGKFTFDGDSQLTDLHDHAFNRVKGLASIALPNGITKLYARTFLSCQDLKKVYIPASVIYLENEIFLGATSLDTIYRETPSASAVDGPMWNIISYGDGAYSPNNFARVEIVDRMPSNWQSK